MEDTQRVTCKESISDITRVQDENPVLFLLFHSQHLDGGEYAVEGVLGVGYLQVVEVGVQGDAAFGDGADVLQVDCLAAAHGGEHVAELGEELPEGAADDEGGR